MFKCLEELAVDITKFHKTKNSYFMVKKRANVGNKPSHLSNALTNETQPQET